MINTTNQQILIDRTFAVLALANTQYGKTVFDPANLTISFELKSRRIVGTCRLTRATGQAVIRYNPEAVENLEALLAEKVVEHEVAHLVCQAMDVDDGHGRNWRDVCRHLGGIASRTCSGPLLPPVARRYRMHTWMTKGGPVLVNARHHALLVKHPALAQSKGYIVHEGAKLMTSREVVEKEEKWAREHNALLETAKWCAQQIEKSERAEAEKARAAAGQNPSWMASWE